MVVKCNQRIETKTKVTELWACIVCHLDVKAVNKRILFRIEMISGKFFRKLKDKRGLKSLRPNRVGKLWW